MDHFAGLDVSVKETSVCIVDDTGKIVREVKVASEPEALLVVLKNPSYRFKRIRLEAGPLSQWLFGALAEAGLPVICVETRQMRAVLKAQINKTDRNDARGMAQMMRVGLYRPVHVKTLRSQKLRMLLTHRKLLQSKAIAIDNDLRGTLRNFGLKVGMVGMAKFETRIKELVENLPDLAMLVEPLLIVRRVLREQIGILHRRLLAVVREDDVCRRLMTVPGVGPVVALTFRVTVDVPARFRNSKSVGAAFGLTPSKYQSGESERTGGISRCGDERARASLRNRHKGPSIMGFEDEVEQSLPRPCHQTDDRSKRTHELTSSIVPRGTSFHRSVEFEFLLSHSILHGPHAAATSRVQRNSVPSTQMRCMITANRRASATIAFFIPRCRAIFIAHALSHDHFVETTSMVCAAS